MQALQPVLYLVRYRALKAATTIRNIGACVAFLAGSYVVSGLLNASPVTQPDLAGPRSRTVIVAPAAPGPVSTPGEAPAANNPEADIAPKPHIVQSL